MHLFLPQCSDFDSGVQSLIIRDVLRCMAIPRRLRRLWMPPVIVRSFTASLLLSDPCASQIMNLDMIQARADFFNILNERGEILFAQFRTDIVY